MKFLKVLFYTVPFVITVIVVFAFSKKNDIIDLPKYEKPQVETVDQTPKYVEDFLLSNSKLMDIGKFEKIKIQKDNKIFSYKELNETKQKLIQILIYKQLLSKTDEFIKSNNIKIENFQNLIDFYSKIENNVANSKNFIYKLHGSSLHPLDKDFLETLK